MTFSKYSDKQIQFLNSLKNKTVKIHKKCKGTGYLDEDMTPCECMKVFKYLRCLYYSNIPIDYWDLKFDELDIDIIYKKSIKEFIDNIDNAIEKGLGIMFVGERGIGKTSLSCEIAKEAVIKRYDVYYEIMQNIVDDRFSDNHRVLYRIKNSDLLIIDELDKVLMRENSNIPKQIENLLRDTLPNGKSVILCSNLNEDEIEDRFRILSLIKRYINIVPMEGKDYSDIKQNKWMDKLKDNSKIYMRENIVKMAEAFYNNETIANEKEFDSIF